MGHMLWLVILTAFGTDIMAYFTGFFLGKHKLCLNISPKKTVEGAIGGIVGSVILCTLFGYLISEGPLIHFILIGLFGSMAAQAGDLTASIFKRKMGIKDYGNLIPGHGGILDRFDSVLFTAPFVYYYIMLVMF
jgi:phosphatidate cytidylyltransferase